MKDYYTTEDITNIIHELTLALWQFEKRADSQEIEHMNTRLGLLQVYPKSIAFDKADNLILSEKLRLAGWQ